MTIDIIPLWIICCVACALFGAEIGARREARTVGIWLGLLFGPLGLIALQGFDYRPLCRTCGGPLNRVQFTPRICPHCHTRLQWERGQSGDEVLMAPPRAEPPPLDRV